MWVYESLLKVVPVMLCTEVANMPKVLFTSASGVPVYSRFRISGSSGGYGLMKSARHRLGCETDLGLCWRNSGRTVVFRPETEVSTLGEVSGN